MSKDYTYLNIDNVCGAGWFQWYDLNRYHEYPECHVLMYKIDENDYCSEILDFNVSSSGETEEESFISVSNLALEFFDELRKRNGNIDIEEKQPEYWNKYREIYFRKKVNRFLAQDGLRNSDEFPFSVVKENNRLRSDIQKMKKDVLGLKEDLKNKENTIEVLQTHISEIHDSIIQPEKANKERLYLEKDFFSNSN